MVRLGLSAPARGAGRREGAGGVLAAPGALDGVVLQGAAGGLVSRGVIGLRQLVEDVRRDDGAEDRVGRRDRRSGESPWDKRSHCVTLLSLPAAEIPENVWLHRTSTVTSDPVPHTDTGQPIRRVPRLRCCASCVSGCFSLAAAARACSRRPTPSPRSSVLRFSPRRPLPALEEQGGPPCGHTRSPTHHDEPVEPGSERRRSPHPGHQRHRAAEALGDADPQVRQLRGRGHPRPHLAGQPHHQGPPLAVDRPARRQPGADRPDVAGPQARDVRPAGEDGLQGDRGRLPLLR